MIEEEGVWVITLTLATDFVWGVLILAVAVVGFEASYRYWRKYHVNDKEDDK